MATDVKKKVVEVDVRAQKIGELKEQVKELTKLMDSLDKESIEYHRTVDMLVEAEEELTTVMKVGKSQLSAQEGSYNALVNKMAALKKAQKAVTDEASRMRLGDDIRKINDELKRIDENNGVYVRNVGNYENAVKKALKTPQQELKALRVQLAQLEQGTAEYNATFARMAQLTHDVTEQQEMLRWSSADLGDILGNVAGVATSVAGGFSAVNALGGLLGMGENEDLEKAMLQAQRFLQLIQGLEQLEQLADKIKGLWKGIQNFANTTTVGTAALTDFQQETAKAEAASTGAASAISTNAAATNTGAEATNKAAVAATDLAVAMETLGAAETKEMTVSEYRLDIGKRKLKVYEDELLKVNERLKIYEAEDIASQKTLHRLRTTKKTLEDHIETEKKNIKSVEQQIAAEKAQGRETAKVTVAIQANTAATELNHKGLKGRLATMILNNKQNKLTVTELNAMTTAQLASTAATIAWSGALKILKTALISTGIGVIIVALGALLNLLGKGVKSLWGWISGANKAKETTETLNSAMDALNESLAAQEKAWERQEMLLDAQGKSYEEIYEARKKNLQAQLAEAQALLASQKAIADDIGQRKLQKKKYDEFRETLEELTQREKELKEALDDLDYEKYIQGIKDKKKADEDAANAQKRATEQAIANYNKEKDEADKLYKSLIEHFKDEKTKLKEKYEEEKALLEKYGKDTTNLTLKYEQDKTAIVLKEAEARKKADEEYNKLVEEGMSPLELLDEKVKETKAKYEDLKKFLDDGGITIPKADKDRLGIKEIREIPALYEKAKKEYEEAEEALANYQAQLAQEKSDKRVAEIEKEIASIQRLMEQKQLEAEQEYFRYESENNYYTDVTNNYISQMYKRWETENNIHQLRLENLQEMADKYKAASESELLTEKDKTEALAKYKEIQQQITNEKADHIINSQYREMEAWDNYAAAIQDSLGGITQILETVAGAWETSIQAQIDAGEISEEEGERQMENMKGIQSAITLINALASAVSAYQSMASIPVIGPALGAAAAVAALASGLAQVAAINKVKKGDTGENSSVRYAEVTPTLPDYNPQGITNVTGEQETQDLANAMTKSNIWVSVKDIDSAQSKVKTRDKEATF